MSASFESPPVRPVVVALVLAAFGGLAGVACKPSEAGSTRARDVPGKKVTPPTLTVSGDTITFQGWMISPPNMDAPYRLTLTATPDGATLVHEAAHKL